MNRHKKKYKKPNSLSRQILSNSSNLAKIKKDDKIKHPDIDLVINSLEYLDKANEENNNLFKRIHYCKFIDVDKDLEYNKVIFYDKDKKEIYQSIYENIGVYHNDTEIWEWAWSISSFKKNSTNIIRKILTYGTELDSDSLFIKNELITSKIKISDPVQLEIVLSLSSYLSKKQLIYGIKVFNNKNIDSDGIINITEPLVEGNEIKYIKHYLFLLDIKK
jgi:hypothetical protein